MVKSAEPRVSYWRLLAVPLIALLLAYAAAATIVFWLGDSARAGLRDAFDRNARATASTISRDIDETRVTLRRHAELFLSGRHVSPADLQRSATALGITRAELSGPDGTVIQAVPPKTTPTGARTPPLRAGTLSSPEGLVVTTPFTSTEGERRLSVAVDFTNDPLGRALGQQLLPAGSTEAVLVDATGVVVADAHQSPTLWGAAAGGFGADPPARFVPGPDQHVAGFPVRGTSFRLVAATSRDDLYRPVSTTMDKVREVGLVGGVAGILVLFIVTLVRRNGQLTMETIRLDRHRAELAAYADELEASNTSLRAASSRITDLIAMLTHDVRQPIAVITGYCELIIAGWDETTDEDKQHDVKRITDAATTMGTLVEEILTLSQLDDNNLVARRTPLVARDCVAEAVGHACVANRDTIRIVTPDDEVRVLADPRHLQQMLVNVISNSLKYGSPPVEVRVSTTADGVELEVRDSGEGVPDEFVPHLFDRYARASTGVAPTKKGTGLGLFIVRELAHANGGTITYRRRPTGACFVISLPTADAAVPTPQAV